jgi:uncharacterized protein
VDLRFFNIKNPWRKGAAVGAPAIRRKILDQLPRWLEDDEIVVLHGPRRVGKSTLLQAIVRELLVEHRVSSEDIYFFDLDTLDCSDVLASPSTLLDFIGIPERRTYVLIDEVQRLESPGLFLKGLHDLALPLKVIVSGSSSLELRSRVRESLSGRKRLSRLGGLDWNEFRSVRQEDADFWEFLIYGGYPAVVLADEPAEKRRLLLEYFECYLDRDIDSFLRVDRLDVFRQLIRLLGFQTGNLVNLNELSSSCQVSRDTMRRYLSYLEETFIVRRLEPFSRNPRKEISKMPKVYFADCGWRNLVSAGFNDWEERADRGGLLESAVEQWLRGTFPLANIHFWRSQAKAEVDFVVDDGGKLHAFEVKASSPSRPTVSRSLRSFIQTYSPASATVVNLGLEAEVDVEGLPVRFDRFPRITM